MKAMTVLGPVPVKQLGKVLIHEHLLFDFRDYWQEPKRATELRLTRQPVQMELLGTLRFNPMLLIDNLVQGDLQLAIDEANELVAVGGQTLVDPTNVSIGRDPVALQQIARVTGLNIIMGAGYYTEISLDETFDERSLEELTNELTREVLEGVAETGVRAGLIGEIGTSSPITDRESKSLRAAARAHTHTRAPLMIHLDGWGREGHKVLDIVEEEGGDPGSTILCHMNPSWADVEYQASLAERGAYLEYDMMGMDYFYPPDKACPDDLSTLGAIKNLIETGFLDKLLLSQDVFLKMMFKLYGGLGYTHVFTNLGPYYQQLGITSQHLNTIFVENPARALGFLE